MITTYDEYIDLIDSEDNSIFRRAIVEPISEDVLFKVIGERPDLKKWVIHNKLVPENILIHLSDDQDQDVRCEVAKKRKTPLLYLEKLAHDPIDSVRREVAHHAKISKTILEHLVHDSEPDIAERAMKRLSEQDYKA